MNGPTQGRVRPHEDRHSRSRASRSHLGGLVGCGRAATAAPGRRRRDDASTEDFCDDLQRALRRQVLAQGGVSDSARDGRRREGLGRRDRARSARRTTCPTTPGTASRSSSRPGPRPRRGRRRSRTSRRSARTSASPTGPTPTRSPTWTQDSCPIDVPAPPEPVGVARASVRRPGAAGRSRSPSGGRPPAQSSIPPSRLTTSWPCCCSHMTACAERPPTLQTTRVCALGQLGEALRAARPAGCAARRRCGRAATRPARGRRARPGPRGAGRAPGRSVTVGIT